MNSKVRTLAICGAFVLCLGIVFGILKLTEAPETNQDEEETVDNSFALYEYPRDDVSEIRIENSDGDYTIVRKGLESFSITEIESLPQNETTISAATRCAASVTAEALVEENPEDLSKYGLTDDLYTAKFTVSFKNDKYPQKTVYIGNSVPDNSGYYIKVDDSESVYTAKKSGLNYFTYPAVDYINTLILQEPENNTDWPVIDTLRIQRPDLDWDIVIENGLKGDIESEVTVISAQVMVEPVYAYLDITNSAAVTHGLWGLRANLAVAAFPSEEDFEKYGLDNPTATLTIEAELQTYKLTIGSPVYLKDENGEDTTTVQSYYGYYEGIDAIFLFDAADMPWATVMPADITSSMMTTNYIYDLDTIDIEVYSPEAKTYKIDIVGYKDDNKVDASLNGSEIDGENFKLFYQFLLKCPIEDLWLEEPTGDCFMKVTINTVGGHTDVLEFYEQASRRTAVKLNGHPSFKFGSDYIETLMRNLDAVESGTEIKMDW